MKVLHTVKEWLFYGHLWIAAGAAGLAWWTLALLYPYDVGAGYGVTYVVLRFTFFATLGVYTLHRMLSFRKARGLPGGKRYGIVRRYPALSLFIGQVSLIYAGWLLLPFLPKVWPALIVACALTVFYLVPPLPGWRRLRDLPYVKVLWVAISWTIVTVYLPRAMVSGIYVGPCGGWVYHVDWRQVLIGEYVCRFLFTLAIALLFDLRDVSLDREQGVRTVANTYPDLLRRLVPLLFLACAGLSWYTLDLAAPQHVDPVWPVAAYLLGFPIAWWSYRTTNEDWYAVAVNGMLVLLPFLTYLGWRTAFPPFLMTF